MNLHDTKNILTQLDLRPDKSRGQNFLFDASIKERILSLAYLSDDDVILEVGPGLGVLTAELVKIAKKVYAIEIDSKMCSFLQEKLGHNENLEIINADILKVKIPKTDKMVSNIPYSITGPILEKVFYNENAPMGVLTMESALADRIFSQGAYKKTSRITITANAFLTPMERMSIPSSAFYPRPDIDLSLVKLTPKQELPPFLQKRDSREFFLKLVAGIMPYKNKNLSNALKLFLKQLNVDIGLSRKPFIRKALSKQDIRDKKVFQLYDEEFIKTSELMLELINSTKRR